MKRSLTLALGAAAALLCALCGCRSAESDPSTRLREQVASRLDAGGSCYQYSDLTATLDAFYAYGDRVSRAVLQSDLPAERRATLTAVWNTFLLGVSLSGLDGGVAVGSSSVRLGLPPSSPVRHRNVVCAVRSSENQPGLIWNLFGDGRRDLRGALETVPADALLAADFEFRPELLLKFAEHLASNFRQEGRPEPRFLSDLKETVPSLSGVWRIIVAPPADGARDGALPFLFSLRLPDHDGRLFKLLTGSPAPSAPGAVLPLARFKSLTSSPPAVAAQGDSVVIYSDGQAVRALGDGTPRLSETAGFASLTSGLTLEGSGFLYSAAGLGRTLDFLVPGQLGGVPLPLELPEQLYVLHAEPLGITAEGNSEWDLSTTQLCLKLTPVLMRLASKTVLRVENAAATVRGNADFQSCGDNMRRIGRALAAYARAHGGRFPAGGAVEGMRELISGGYLPAASAVCPAAHGDSPAPDAGSFGPSNCSYVYFGGSSDKSAAKLPLLTDWPLNHRNRFHVLFVDGEIRSYALENLNSCRRLVSFLHSRFRYGEADFQRLMNAAKELDGRSGRP